MNNSFSAYFLIISGFLAWCYIIYQVFWKERDAE